ncbi:hypothetical protein M1432_02535 [Patescibacteria group bacterium]|nr:hypothetical protein [Patescibacteria group bacterium]
MNKSFLISVTILAGTILGAGIFSLPYILGQVGLVLAAAYLLFFGLVYFLVHLFYGEALKTAPPGHNFLYFLRESMNPWASQASSIVVLAEFLLILTVYLILAPAFGALIFGVAARPVLLVFWALGSLFIFFRLSVVGWTEFFGVAALVAFIAVVFGFGSGPLGAQVWPPALNWPLVFLPFGPLLFSLAGRSAMAQVVEKERESAKAGAPFSIGRVAFWGTFLAAAVYFAFAIGVLRLTSHPTPDTLSGLTGLPPAALAVLGVMGLVAIWKSYIVIGLNAKEMLDLDLKWPKVLGALAVVAGPPIFYFLGLNNFLSVIGLLGGLFLAFDSALVVHIWRRLVPRSRWRPVSWALYAIFLAAAVYEIISLA